MRSTILLAIALLAGAQGCVLMPGPARPADPARSAAERHADSLRKADEAAGIKPYDQVVTRASISRDGLFSTHRLGDTLLFEIPRVELNRDMLLVGRFARASGGNRFGGDEFTQRVLRWERQGHRILLRSVSYEITADSTLPVYQAVSQATYPPIVAVFRILAYGPDSAAVIDATSLYTTSIPEFVAVRGAFDEKRSFIERVAAFPENVEVEATQTFTPDNPFDAPRGSLGPVPAQSILAHWSMIRLPLRPMSPRLADRRVGFISVRQTDFGTPEHRSVTRAFITRWRLEKKHPDSAVSEPVRPIVFYVDRATPAQWVPWVKKGIEDWQVAFEAAGFRRAIVARDAPSPAEDPDWSPDDVRYSVVRWLPSTIENADAPHVHDPRTGEILNGSMRIHHNVLNLVRNWYFTQVAALDPRAGQLPFPDSLMGRLLQYVVAHEIGHAIGLQHNLKASSTYPADSVRSVSWLARMGHTPTLMDYSRFNYVAQPEDRIPPELLIPRVGPYDLFATRWGYAPIPGARAPEDERPTLSSWAEMQDSIPWYRFTTSGPQNPDPGDLSEAVGDADAVKSTALGLRNIERTVPILLAAAIDRTEDNSTLSELYTRLVDQWTLELEHVVGIVGGADSREKYGGQLGPRFVPVSPARQRTAMRFLAANAFQPPRYLVDTRIVRRIEPEGTLRRIGFAQTRVLSELMDNDRLHRLAEYEALARNRDEAYPLSEMLSDLRRSVWSELASSRVAIDPFRRSLQRSWLVEADAKVNPAPAVVFGTITSARTTAWSRATPNTDVRALVRGELLELDAALSAALPRAADRTTRLHILDARSQIARILDPDA